MASIDIKATDKGRRAADSKHHGSTEIPGTGRRSFGKPFSAIGGPRAPAKRKREREKAKAISKNPRGFGMSFDLFKWARGVDLEGIRGVSRSTAKLVLVMMAGTAKPHYFGSMAALAKETCLDRKAVLRAVAALAELGIIRDTGTRRGQTKQIVEWEFIDLSTELSTKGTQLGTVPNKEQFPIARGTVPNCRVKGPQLGIRNLKTELLN